MKISKYHIYVILISIINLGLLYFLKYYQNNLEFSQFSIFKTGNLISLILTTVLIIGTILYSSRADQNSFHHQKLLFLFSLIYFFPLVIVLVLNLSNFQFSNEYLLGYPFKKIIPVIFFVVNQTVFVFVIILVWYLYVGYSILSYFYSVLVLLLIITVLVVFTFLYTFSSEEYVDNRKEIFDYGIVLGAAVWKGNIPSPVFQKRIEKSAELYRKGLIKKIQLTGGNAPGELSEAKTALNYLKEKMQLKQAKIQIEEKTSTTNEQIKFICNNLRKQKNANKFLIISDKFHLRRVLEMADFYNLNAQVISSEINLNTKKSLYYRLRDSIGLILFWFFAI